jgi:hypothetical protein
MFAATFAAVSSLKVIRFGENNIAFRRQVVVFFGHFTFLGKATKVFTHDTNLNI